MALRRAGRSAAPRVATAPPRCVPGARAATARAAGRLRLAASTATAPAAAAATSHSSGSVLSWVASAPGGFVHPSLAVVDAAPCGCRGVVATADITSDAPLIAVPEQLAMSTQDALDVLTTLLADTTQAAPRGGGLLQQLLQGLGLQQQDQPTPAQRLTQLQPPMLLALLLAHQRRLGAASYWAPYLADLPQEPPCAWYAAALPLVRAWDSQQQQSEPGAPVSGAATAAAGGSSRGASAKAAAAAAAVAAKCTAAAAVFGRALGGLTAEELAWAYGQVVSRAFSTGRPQPDSIALLPAIDMLNHLAGASVPVFLSEQQSSSDEGGGDGSSSSGDGSGAWCIWPQQLTEWDARGAGASAAEPGAGGGHASEGAGGEGAGVVLRAGEELFISYLSGCDAETALLSFGFCPAELS